jgi:flavin reductase (DIM6/NTAB) family NADH-FMN oxidoreductase RutF
MAFKKTEAENLAINPFTALSKDWALVTAGKLEKHNTMTVAWGQMGHIWRKNVFMALVRPSRHTYGFVEENDIFTVSLFGGKQRDALNFCGSKSGRDIENKAVEAGLTPVALGGSTSFEEAETVFVCKKMYRSQLTEENMISPEIKDFYTDDPLHVVYIGEILETYVKE